MFSQSSFIRNSTQVYHVFFYKQFLMIYKGNVVVTSKERRSYTSYYSIYYEVKPSKSIVCLTMLETTAIYNIIQGTFLIFFYSSFRKLCSSYLYCLLSFFTISVIYFLLLDNFQQLRSLRRE